MNVILVVFDSLRKDCLSVYGQPFWGPVQTPHLDAFARESLVMTRAYPESLPTLPTRRALYTGRRVYPFHHANFHLKGDFVGAPGWGPIPEEQDTLAEILHDAGYRTALIADVYHMFKPSKNFARGFDQWMFLRGQEKDPQRSGPRLTQSQVDYWLPREWQTPARVEFVQQCIMNMHGRSHEEDYFAPRVLSEAARWLEQNQDAKDFFLVVESFDPHEPWLAPPYYRRMYMPEEGQEQVISKYADLTPADHVYLPRTQANYAAEVTMCDRWFGHLMETVRALGLLGSTAVMVTTDHGHSIGDGGYLGKRGYPSHPSVYDVPLLLRLPGQQHGGTMCDALVQHTDMAATILDLADVAPRQPLDGASFVPGTARGPASPRDHVTVGWGANPTVITERWWFNGKIDGTGVLLHDLLAVDPFATNVAPAHPQVAQELFDLARADAAGAFPDWLMEMARQQIDAPGCSDLAAR